MTGTPSGGSAVPAHFDIHIPGAAKGPLGPGAGGSVADAIVRTLKQILGKYKNSLAGNNAQITTIKAIASKIAKLETLLTAIGSEEGITDPDTIASGIKKQCADLLTLVGKITDPVARAQLTEQVKSIANILNTSGVLSTIADVASAMKGIMTLIHEMQTGQVTPSDLPALTQFYNDYETVNGAVGYGKSEGTIQTLYNQLHKLFPSMNLQPITDLLKNLKTAFYSLQWIWPGKGVGVNQGHYLAHDMEHWSQNPPDKSWLKSFVKQLNEGWNIYGYTGNWNKVKGEVEAAIGEAGNLNLKFSGGQLIKLLNGMIHDTYGLNAGSLSGLWQAYVNATTGANDIVNQTDQMSNQQATSVQASTTAMQSLIRSMEKDMMVPIQLVDKSLSGIL